MIFSYQGEGCEICILYVCGCMQSYKKQQCWPEGEDGIHGSKADWFNSEPHRHCPLVIVNSYNMWTWSEKLCIGAT